MLNYVCIRYEDTEEIKSVEDFCRKVNIQYIGYIYSKKSGCSPIDGELISFDGAYYNAQSISFSPVTNGVIQSRLSCYKLADSFPVDDYSPSKNFDIIIHVWDVSVEKEAPISCWAFKRDQLREVQEKFKDEDIDIYIDGTEINKELFMTMTA